MRINYEELEKLGKLKEQGILSQEEFEIEKKKILSGEDNNKNNSGYGNMNYKSLSTYEDDSNHNIFQKFFSPRGRMNRGEYLMYISISFIPFLILSGLSLFFRDTKDLIPFLGGGLIIYTFFWIYSLFILAIKKLHDIDTSGWMSIVVNIFAPISTFILLFIPGTKGDNRFGPNKGKDNILIVLLIIFWIALSVTILLGKGYNYLEKLQTENIHMETIVNKESVDSDFILNHIDNTCGKNSTLGEDGKCHCLSGYKRENYEDANNFDCIKN